MLRSFRFFSVGARKPLGDLVTLRAVYLDARYVRTRKPCHWPLSFLIKLRLSHLRGQRLPNYSVRPNSLSDTAHVCRHRSGHYTVLRVFRHEPKDPEACVWQFSLGVLTSSLCRARITFFRRDAAFIAERCGREDAAAQRAALRASSCVLLLVFGLAELSFRYFSVTFSAEAFRYTSSTTVT